MNGVTGPYAKKIFEEKLGAKKGSVINSTPLEDFGGLHPDPNLIYAKHLVDLMYSESAPDFAAANDGDGDRNMILGKSFFVSPSDCLAVLTDNYKLIPAYKNGIYGVAKSAATLSGFAIPKFSPLKIYFILLYINTCLDYVSLYVVISE